jgi:hypothetical protein
VADAGSASVSDRPPAARCLKFTCVKLSLPRARTTYHSLAATTWFFQHRLRQRDPVNMTHSPFSRRHFLQALSLLATNAVMASSEGTQASDAGTPQNDGVEYGKNTLLLAAA